MTEPTAAGVLAALRARGATLATAESLTGGMLAARLVDVPGASAVFRGGLVPYATDLKATLVGVNGGLLDRLGPVAGEVAAALAEGGRRRCGADWGLATTGVAGPDSQGEVPAGTVYVGVAGPDGAPTVRKLSLDGDRPTIRAATVESVLALLAERLDATR
ncbi:CinA family protein [Cryptosporangium minutisporangium]|uniref:CinA family protein n=1 Tax=Cryptosporangium minutisporangium TaxID=113569 RepID=UPI0035E9333E